MYFVRAEVTGKSTSSKRLDVRKGRGCLVRVSEKTLAFRGIKEPWRPTMPKRLDNRLRRGDFGSRRDDVVLFGLAEVPCRSERSKKLGVRPGQKGLSFGKAEGVLLELADVA